jgi:Tfp pilus assembly protein PilW
VSRLPATHTPSLIRGQAGFSLVEQLIALVLLTTVMGATLTALESMLRSTPANEEWNHTVADTQAGLFRMTRELRQGFNVTLVTEYVASADVVVNGATRHVLYQCDLSSACTRKFTTAPTAAPARGAGGETLMGNVQSYTEKKPVYTSPASKYFQIAVIVRSAGSVKTAHTHNITLTDGFFARNS